MAMRHRLLLAASIATVGSGTAYWSPAAEPTSTFGVVIATHDLASGVPIRFDDVAVRDLAPDMIPAHVTFSTVDDVVGRTPRERILSNEVLRVERLASRDAGVGIAALVSPGMRAMSVSVRTDNVEVGNVVDVIGSTASALPVVRSVKVLAVDTGAITIEVTLDQAEAVALAFAQGTLTTVLRSDLDIAAAGPPRRTGRDIEPSPQSRDYPPRLVPRDYFSPGVLIGADGFPSSQLEEP